MTLLFSGFCVRKHCGKVRLFDRTALLFCSKLKAVKICLHVLRTSAYSKQEAQQSREGKHAFQIKNTLRNYFVFKACLTFITNVCLICALTEVKYSHQPSHTPLHKHMINHLLMKPHPIKPVWKAITGSADMKIYQDKEPQPFLLWEWMYICKLRVDVWGME